MLEERVKRLEADMGEAKADLKAIRSTLDQMKGKLETMPTSLQLIGFAVAVFVAAGVLRFFD